MQEKLQELFREVLNEKELILTNELSEKDVASWNSLNNVVLISKIESSFDVKFELADILKIKNVGDIKTLIEKSKKG
ncbi:MAG: acyl carrier protein [Flavobacteriales bacterium]|nr:acyl carrier protein [Flavobacteriales bacterium]